MQALICNVCMDEGRMTRLVYDPRLYAWTCPRPEHVGGWARLDAAVTDEFIQNLVND